MTEKNFWISSCRKKNRRNDKEDKNATVNIVIYENNLNKVRHVDRINI